MKTVKVKFCDGIDADDLVFLPLLKKHYSVELSDQPDYIFYGPFGYEHLKYRGIRIFTTGECITPNFNECDYATGFDYQEFGDRYLRLPLCSIMFRDGQNTLSLALKQHSHVPAQERAHFCSYTVSNGHGMKQRTEIFYLLNAYRKVDSGGKFLNNIGHLVEDKLAFDRQHRFVICFENQSHPGYLTEKLVDAFAAGAIPIYYGDPTVAETFNPKAFINCHNFRDMEQAARYVIEVDRNPLLYQSILSEPILRKSPPGLPELEAFLCHIMDQDLSDARRRPSVDPYILVRSTY